MRVLLLIAAALLLCACNLSDVQPNTPTPPLPQMTDAPTDVVPSPLPGVQRTADPNALPTRTPVGNLLPTPTQFSGIGGDAFPPIPTSATGERAVISSPAEGTILTNGTLQISGIITNLTRSDFTLALLAPNGQSINTQTITLQSAPVGVRDVPWSAAMMVSRYNGPVEIQVRAQTAAGQEILLARTNIVIQAGASNVSAPSSSAAPLVSIDSPADNSTTSESIIQISGNAGGIAENQFTLSLVGADGGVINSQIITLTNPNYTTVVPWAASLRSNGYRGAAELRALAGSTLLDTVRITIQ